MCNVADFIIIVTQISLT